MTRSSADLRYSVTLSASTPTDQGGGSVTHAFAEVDTVRAAVRALSAREVSARGFETDAEAYEVTLRKPLPSGADITTDFRVAWQSRTYSVESIERTDRRYYSLTMRGPVPEVAS